MTTRRSTLVTIVCAIAILASIAGVGAQETSQKFNRRVTVQNGAGEPVQVAVGDQGDNTFVFVSSEMSMDGQVVKGAPYSAQAVTESIQTLADGNRIVRRSTASVYRDGEGRTRREQTLNAVGAYSASGDSPQMIFINDPVSQANYILDAKSHTARKMELSSVGIGWDKKAAEGAGKSTEGTPEQKQKAMADMKKQKAVADMKMEMAHAEAGAMTGPGGAFNVEHFVTLKTNGKNTRKESLGKQTIEGVEAEGVRYTTTIAAGEIGNEQPIDVVYEKWYSPELQTVVMTRNSDPRVGENTYRLTNINRSEPAHSLFEVPSDYTIKETVGPNMRYKIEQEVRRPGAQN